MAPNSTSSALVPVKVDNDNLVEEKIDERILAILGIGDVFDLTYEEYIGLLKEKSIEYRMTEADVPTESVELISEEFKRVKGKSGKFKVKSQKIDFQKVVNVREPSPQKAQLDPSKLLPPVKEEETIEVKKEPSIGDVLNFLRGDLLDGLKSIVESLNSINQTLKEQNQIDKKTRESQRKSTELEKKSRRESELESKPGKNKEEEKKLKTPAVNFFDSIKKFVTNVLLGSVVLGLFKWLKDPKNEKAINGFGEFLTDNAPLILGGLLAIAALPIAATLLNLSIGIVSGIGVLTGALTKLGAFLVSPLGLGLLGALGLYGLAAKYRQIRDENIEQRMSDAERGTELIEKGGKPVMANTPSGVATLTGDRRPWWQKISQSYDQFIRTGELPNLGLGGIKNALFGKKDIAKSENLDELRREYSRVNNELYNKIQAYKSGDIRFNKDIEKLSIEKNTLSKRIKEVEKFVPKSTSSQDPYAGADGLQRQLDDLAKPQTPSVQPKTPKITDYVSPFTGARDREALKASKITGNAPITIGEKAGYSVSRGRIHAGRDISAPSGTGLQVPSDSVITDKGVDGGYGNYVVFKDASGIEHLYGHMLEATPYNKGDSVSAGTVIGRVGSTGRSTGPHLHWEVSRKIGEVGRPRANIIDPIEMGFPAQAPFTGKVEAAQLAQTKPSVPSIPSPSGRSNITMLPLATGASSQQVSSGTSPNQAPVPNFSSEDPNNMTMLTVKAIYNVVG